jgi:probable biosynthetic protein (TIGR04098 family)
MNRSRSRLQLGMPHTRCHAISEIALLSHAAHLRWGDISTLSGTAASRQRDAEGRPVYASIYYVDIAGFPAAGLGAFGPDDELEVVSTLGRFGRSMMDGEHRMYPVGVLPAELPATLPDAPRVQLSNVLVAVGKGADDLRIAWPENARIEEVPVLPAEPESYRTIKRARQEGRFFSAPEGATPLWSGAQSAVCAVNPDRDLNGVGLLYFCNYVAFMDFAERKLLEEGSFFSPEELDRRVTVRRQIGFYGNAQPHETLEIEVEAASLAGDVGRLILHHRVRRRSDQRLIAVGSVEKTLYGPAGPG